jgi:hypothetical protein
VSIKRYPRKPRPKTRLEFYDREAQVWEEMVSTWRGLPDVVLAQPGACGDGWSIKDVMNHIAAWQEVTIQALPDLLEGKHVPYPGVARFNSLHQQDDKTLSLEASTQRFHATRQKLLEMIGVLPDDLLLDPNSKVGYWVKYATYGHYSGHIFDLRDFCSQLRDN